jgi:hypothetical protein
MVIARWLIFGVIFGILPIMFAYACKATMEKSHRLPSIKRTIVHGELLLVSVALSSDALGEVVVATGKRNRNLRLLGAGGCAICIFCSSAYFAFVSNQEVENVGVVFWLSIALFAFTLLSAGLCKTVVKV